MFDNHPMVGGTKGVGVMIIQENSRSDKALLDLKGLKFNNGKHIGEILLIKCPKCRPHTGIRRLLFWRTLHKMSCQYEKFWNMLDKQQAMNMFKDR